MGHTAKAEPAYLDQTGKRGGAAHQQTAAVLSTVLAEASARPCEDLVLSDATDVIARAQAREE